MAEISGRNAMLILYHAETAVCAAKVRVTLAEKDITFESKMIDLGRGDQFAPEYRAINPNAAVPVIIHDGLVLAESTVINEYLDEVFPSVPLRPADAYGRARMRLWTKREDHIHDAINTMTTAIVFRADLMDKPPEERRKRYEGIPDPAKREKWRQLLETGLDSSYVSDALARFNKLFRDMDKALATGPWLVGEAFTLADVGFISFFYRMEAMQAAGIWTKHYPRVADWFDRCKARPSFNTAIADYIPAPRAAHFTRVSTPLREKTESAFAQAMTTA
jgi:glutathione S-transferase